MRIPELGLFIKDRNIVDEEFGPLKIDKVKVKKFSWRHRGNVRLSSGKFFTYKEFEERKKRVFGSPLP